MKRLAKIASLILTVAVMTATFILIPANEHLHVHAERAKVYNGTKYSLTMDTSSATQGQFSFVYASSHDELLGDAPSYPTANGDVLEVDGRQLFSVASDGYIHMDIPATYSDPAFFAGVVFTAPVSGVYTFTVNVGLYRPGGGWTTDGGNWNNFRLYAAGYDVDSDSAPGTGAGDNWPIIDHNLYNAANGTGDTEEIVTKTITMSEGDKIAFIPACGANGATDLVRQFDVTLDNIIYELKMDTSSAAQGQFSFNYAAGDIVNAFADNANHPTADNGVLKVGDRELFTVASDGYIHANIPASSAEYYTAVVFTAPVTGTYTFNMNVGLYRPGGGWTTDGGNWNNHYVYAAGYDFDSDTSANVGAMDNWPVRNQVLYNAGNGTGNTEVIVNKTLTMNKGDKIAWLPVCGANGASDLIRTFTVTLDEVNCTNHVWNGDNVCDDCGYTCASHVWNGDNACDTCGTTCTDHDYDTEYNCKTCGTPCPHTTKTIGNCQTDITCEACGNTFGKNDAVHAGQPQWVDTDTPATTHKKAYSCCPTVVVENEAEHNWDEDACIDCSYVCQHPSWGANGCTVCGATCDHEGGTATCTTRATCGECGEPYGNTDPTNHTGQKDYTAGDANGHVATWNCGCNVVDTNDTEHDFVNGVCDDCDYECEHTGEAPKYTVNGDKHSAKYECCAKVVAENADHDFTTGDCVCGAKKPAPPTGDSGVALAVVLVTLCGFGIAFVSKKRSGR